MGEGAQDSEDHGSAKPAHSELPADAGQISSLPKAAMMWACESGLTTIFNHSCLWETDWEMASDPPSPVSSLSLEDVQALGWLLPTDLRALASVNILPQSPAFVCLESLVPGWLW